MLWLMLKTGSIADMDPSTPIVTTSTRLTVSYHCLGSMKIAHDFGLEEYFEGIAGAYREEFKELYDLGCSE